MDTGTEKIRIGISPCLLGEKIRYDGTHQLDRYIVETLGRYFEWVPVCPEVEYGLGVPREALRLTGDPRAPRLVTARSGVDHTEGMRNWAQERLVRLEGEGLSGFIFKARSPSSGLYGVKVYDSSGVSVKKGYGIFGGMFTSRFPLVPAEDDGRLHSPELRENFIERIFVYKRWQALCSGTAMLKDLVEFHTVHKLLVLSHSPRHYAELGRLVAQGKNSGLDALKEDYIKKLTEAMKLPATAKKNTNVLSHIAGYFKKVLSRDEKKEMEEVVGYYHSALVPLIVPVTLLKHYTRKYDEPYLKRQVYLSPHPMEMMLRNHV